MSIAGMAAIAIVFLLILTIIPLIFGIIGRKNGRLSTGVFICSLPIISYFTWGFIWVPIVYATSSNNKNNSKNLNACEKIKFTKKIKEELNENELILLVDNVLN